jgi:hypothetical protein
MVFSIGADGNLRLTERLEAGKEKQANSVN